ncbi:pyruvate kinase, partial [Bacillus altitudinis]|uniref:pyruvate kinase n=1 Tax=Bacillus altitudinis TaxID=293387 RepID=UPI003B51D5D2
SHPHFQQHRPPIQNIPKPPKTLPKHIPILLHTKPPHIPTPTLQNPSIHLVPPPHLILTIQHILPNTQKITLTYQHLIHHLQVHSTILLDHALIPLQVKQ